jgi:hypothetical protein
MKSRHAAPYRNYLNVIPFTKKGGVTYNYIALMLPAHALRRAKHTKPCLSGTDRRCFLLLRKCKSDGGPCSYVAVFVTSEGLSWWPGTYVLAKLTPTAVGESHTGFVGIATPSRCT